MINKFKQLKSSGFTLMEVMVAMSIFIIVALASLTIYAAILRASQRTTAVTRIQQEAQLIMEVLAKKIRTSRVNYQYYSAIHTDRPMGTQGNYNEVIGNPDIGDPEPVLALTDSSNTDYLFSVHNNSLFIQSKGSTDQYWTTEKEIPSQLVGIESLNFLIKPLRYPFDINNPPETQPRVTFAITFTASKGTQTASFTVQQTVPQRSGGIVE
jgi:prepilin-type N-terminal cleavage/methylation domain-containing protein